MATRRHQEQILERLYAEVPDRIAEKIIPRDGCWSWTGAHANGYGYVQWHGRVQPLHRVVMEVLGYDIDGKDVDHLCRNRGCCNPEHLEPVSHKENMRRAGIEPRDRCARAGHDWSDPRNVYVRKNGKRHCAECARQDNRAKYQARKAAAT